MKYFQSALLACLTAAGVSAQPKLNEPPAVLELAEDDVEPLLGKLNNDQGGDTGSSIDPEFRDVFSGVASIRGATFQRFSARIKDWNFPIAEKPQPGQYRYLRFAWKRTQAPGIMIQLHNSNGSWNQRYFSGQVSPQTTGWGPMINVSPAPPRDWVVVTRDLFKDFGAMTISGFAFTVMEGGGIGYFDHVHLGRSIEDLDRVTAAAFGKTRLKDALTQVQMEKLWEDLASRNVNIAGPALRTLLAGRKESLSFLQQRLAAKKPAAADDKLVPAWIAALDDDDFRTRENAFRQLDKWGAKALAHMRRARVDATSLEMQKRLDHLIKKHGGEVGTLTTDQLRLLRAIRILEWSETEQAIEVLHALDREPLEAGLNVEVKTALQRSKTKDE